jgi:hypothetical protein
MRLECSDYIVNFQVYGFTFIFHSILQNLRPDLCEILYHPFLSYFPYFEKNKKRLMRSLYYLSVYLAVSVHLSVQLFNFLGL